MKDIKVGDKIEIADARATEGKYKNGDILTIQQIIPNGVYVQEHNQMIWPIEFIVLQTFKKGDKVRIIDKPWNHPEWQRLTRDTKRRHARHIGKEFEVATGNVLNLCGLKRIQVCHENMYEFLIGDFLEKVEKAAQPLLDLRQGMRVRVRKYEDMRRDPRFEPFYDSIHTTDGGCFFDLTMIKYCGDEFTVDEIVPTRSGNRTRYCNWTFSPEMLELVETKEKPQLTLEEKIKEAQRIIGEIVAGFTYDQTCLFNCIDADRAIEVLYIKNSSTSISYIPYYQKVSELKLRGYEVIIKTAVCAPSDEYVEVIGKMIALCRAVGRDLPEWV